MNPSLIVLLRRRFSLCVATPSSGPLTVKGLDSKYLEWDKITAKFAGAANVPFLLLQVPLIVLNAQNLLARNKAALFAVPWFTGSAWTSFLHGWGNLLCMYWNDFLERYYSLWIQFTYEILVGIDFWIMMGISAIKASSFSCTGTSAR